MHQNKNQNTKHVPVLLDEVLQYLDPKEGDSYLDLTAGYGGHASAILDRTGSLTQTELIDRDPSAVAVLQKKYEGKVSVRQADFLSASRDLHASGSKFDLILADLGVSSPHLNEGSRGFSIAQNGPLDMRMDQSQKLTAFNIVNDYKEDELAAILRTYGEEPRARAISKEVVESRPVQTTAELAAIVKRVRPERRRIHPATRTFQALRIAVNDELGQLEQALPLWFDLLAPGGRIAVISFHSLEDRLVKRAFAEAGGERYDADLKLLTKRPIMAAPSELVFNPRARSAKLRAAAKINKKGN